MGREGVEPSTSRLSGVRSNHLSYRPNLLGRRGPGQGSQCFALESLAFEGGVEPVARAARANQTSSGFTRTGSASFGGAYRDRTDDLLNAIQSLSQLS